MTDTTTTGSMSRPSWLTHPILAWRAYQAALAERADAEAAAAGLTVQVLPNGVRRYRHAHLDQALAAYRARHTTPDQTDLADRRACRRTGRRSDTSPRGRRGVVAVSPQRVERRSAGRRVPGLRRRPPGRRGHRCAGRPVGTGHVRRVLPRPRTGSARARR